MKKLLKLIKVSSILGALCCLLLFSESCVTEPDIVTGIVQVVDSNSVPQKNVRVEISNGEDFSELIAAGNSNDVGRYSFEVNEYEFVRVYAVRIDSSIIQNNNEIITDTFCGDRVFVVQEDNAWPETVVIRECRRND